jgi:hypothetical protein
MRRIIATIGLLVCSFIVYAQQDTLQHIGKWSGKDNTDVLGSIIFAPDHYFTMTKQGQTMGGKEFIMQGMKCSIKYDINYNVNPYRLDVIVYNNAIKEPQGTMKGIFRFMGKDTMLLRLNFNPNQPAPREFKDLDDEFTILLKREQ